MKKMSDTDEIKRRLGNGQISRILSDLGYPDGTKKILCPLHNEKTPSMHVNNDFLHCFGCGGGYDIFDHMQSFHGLNFQEALTVLAEEVGYVLTGSNAPSKLKHKINIDPDGEFSATIKKIKRVKPSDEYLKSRGYLIDVANKFGVTFSDSEVYFNHYEISKGKWIHCYAKRRKLDGSMYQYTDSNGVTIEQKEIGVKGGNGCFFGLTTLFEGDKSKPFAIICEGHTDALRLASALSASGLFDLYGVLSVANGSQSLKKTIECSPTFRKWYKSDASKNVIIIPDCDNGGDLFLKSAIEFLPEKGKHIDLTDLGAQYNEKKGIDISDVLNQGMFVEDILQVQKYFQIENMVNANDIDVSRILSGIWSGFITHDWNDSGLKSGGVTVLTGKRGEGKTTFGRQIVMASALQNERVFCWFGESSLSQEKSRFARMCANSGEIIAYDNGVGRNLYAPNDQAIERFERKYGMMIDFYIKPSKIASNVFDDMLTRMETKAKQGFRLFFIDNLMVLTGGAPNVFREQERIVAGLKEFAINFKSHIILVAHPKSGEGNQKVSGSMEIENRVDTILRYIRVSKGQIENDTALQEFTHEEKSKITAMVLNEKVRDEGESNSIYLEWEPHKGVVIEIASIEKTYSYADEYERKGWWSRKPKLKESRF
jgi:5S rRNA maturation endonuclease (ribonuclease M5)